MTIVELLDYLDGNGIIVTDYEMIEEALEGLQKHPDDEISS